MRDEFRSRGIPIHEQPNLPERESERFSLPPKRYESFREYRPAPLPLEFRRVLRYNDQGDDVFSTKCALVALGYLARRRHLSDRFDDEMRQAVCSLQEQHQLAVNGQVGPQAARALTASLASLRGQNLEGISRSIESMDHLDVVSGWAREKIRSRALLFVQHGCYSPARDPDPPEDSHPPVYEDPSERLSQALFEGAASAGANPRDSSPKFAWSAQWIRYLLLDCGLPLPLHPRGCSATLVSLETWRSVAKSVDALRRTGRPGDIALYDWGPEGNVDRIGLVTALVDGTVESAEGGPDGTVALYQRSLAHVGAFIDIDDLASRLDELEDRFHYLP